jgi:hypothetical protein
MGDDGGELHEAECDKDLVDYASVLARFPLWFLLQLQLKFYQIIYFFMNHSKTLMITYTSALVPMDTHTTLLL